MSKPTCLPFATGPSIGAAAGWHLAITDPVDRWYHNTVTAHLVGAGLDISAPTGIDVCPCCRTTQPDVRNRRRNAAYANEEENWIVCCGNCFEEDVEHYQELWDMYYADCM